MKSSTTFRKIAEFSDQPENHLPPKVFLQQTSPTAGEPCPLLFIIAGEFRFSLYHNFTLGKKLINMYTV
jgi:hypothetical protein